MVMDMPQVSSRSLQEIRFYLAARQIPNPRRCLPAGSRVSRQDVDRLLLELAPSLHHLQIGDITVLSGQQPDKLLAEIDSIDRCAILGHRRCALRGNLGGGLIDPVLSRLQPL